MTGLPKGRKSLNIGLTV